MGWYPCQGALWFGVGIAYGVTVVISGQVLALPELDFFTADLLNGTKVYVLAAIEHGTRRIRILGATGHPVQAWVVQYFAAGPAPTTGSGPTRITATKLGEQWERA